MPANRITRAALALLALWAGGCAPMGYRGIASVPHPETAAVVPSQTQIALPSPRDELRYGLTGGTLVDRAALTRVDAQDVCVQLALWGAPNHPRRNQFEGYNIRLVGEGDASGVREHPRVENVRAWIETRTGTRYFGWGRSGQFAQAIEYRVGDLCFRNEALVDEGTTALSLVLRQGGRERGFQWRFDGSATYRAQEPPAEIHPRPNDPPPQTPVMYGAGRGYMGVPMATTGTVIERVPGGHPVDVPQLEAMIDARWPALRQCLSVEMERAPSLGRMQGRMVAEFTVGPSGVANARVVANDFTPGAADCLVRNISGLPIQPDPLRWTTLFQYAVGTDVEGARR